MAARQLRSLCRIASKHGGQLNRLLASRVFGLISRRKVPVKMQLAMAKLAILLRSFFFLTASAALQTYNTNGITDFFPDLALACPRIQYLVFQGG